MFPGISITVGKGARKYMGIKYQTPDVTKVSAYPNKKFSNHFATHAKWIFIAHMASCLRFGIGLKGQESPYSKKNFVNFSFLQKYFCERILKLQLVR